MPSEQEWIRMQEALLLMNDRLERAESYIARLQDSSRLRSETDGAPRLAWPIVVRSPNTGAKYHLVREVTTGHAEFIAGEPDPANWSDA